MPDLRPLRAVSYQPLPLSDSNGELPAHDMVQAGYEALWGKDGRDDLGMIKKMGGNAVRLYHSFGLESQKDHGAFLDRAEEVGIHVMPGFHTQNLCPDFNCFASWKAAALAGFKKGFQRARNWHPAVSIVVLQEEPDNLNFEGVTPQDCKNGANQFCRLKAALSALDGFLAAEKEAKMVNVSVNITIAWSSAQRDSIDQKFTNEIGIWGFWDMKLGTDDPNHAFYTPVTPKEELQKAFQTRWTNSLNSAAPWTFIKEKIEDKYAPFEPTPWFISGWRPGTMSDQDIVTSLEGMDSSARSGGSFLGNTVWQFQRAYEVPNSTDGLFKLGNVTLGTTGDVCEEDVRTKHQTCNTWQVNCLNATDTPAASVASAWGGKLDGFGQCAAQVKTAENIVV